MSQKPIRRLRPQIIDRIGQLLDEHYRTFTSEELPPRLLEVVRKLDEQTVCQIVRDKRDE
jgi:hypothetical protein